MYMYVKPCFKSRLAIFPKTSLGGQSLDLALFWRRPLIQEARLIPQSTLCIKWSPYCCCCKSNVYLRQGMFQKSTRNFPRTSLGGQSLDLPLFCKKTFHSRSKAYTRISSVYKTYLVFILLLLRWHYSSFLSLGLLQDLPVAAPVFGNRLPVPHA